MPLLVEIVAPRGVFDWIVKIIGFTAAIVLVDMGLVPLLTGDRADPVDNLLMAAAVGLPFVIFCLFLFSYMYQLQQKLKQAVMTDDLTALPNRRMFMDAGPFADRGVVLLLDVDHFKTVNDKYGHEGGDRCLQAVATHLRNETRRGDVISRFGGEEFAVVLRDMDLADAFSVGERLCNGFSFEASLLGSNSCETSRVTLSIGAVTLFPQTLPRAVVGMADQALYLAKQNGRARMEILDVQACATAAPV